MYIYMKSIDTKKKIFTIEWKIASNHKYFNLIISKLHLYLSTLIKYSIRDDNKDNNEIKF